MKLSFVIVNYKSREYLKKCIASVFNNVKNIDFEIIVVNNDQEKLEIGERQNDITIIEINKNVGFGRACNIGAKVAEGGYVCFLNPDTKIISTNLQMIIDEFSKNEKVGVIGPKIISKNGEVQKWSVGEKITILNLFKNNLKFLQTKKIWLAKNKISVDWVTGASLFIRRSLFQKINGFDENFFLYYEDNDLCERVKENGREVLYFPAVKVMHLKGGSVVDKKKQKKEYYKSQDYYLQKHFGKTIAFLARISRNIFLWEGRSVLLVGLLYL